MIRYGDYVVINDSFYKDITAKVLDKRLYANEVQYLVDLQPPRWLSERKLTKIQETFNNDHQE
jgi:hypothetical protein